MQVFNRYEVKYIITQAQYEGILQALLAEERMRLDRYNQTGESYPIQSLYYASVTDAVSQQALRLEPNEFKQRLRMRSYGPANADKPVFLEIKKKFLKKTYKRRITVDYETANRFLAAGEIPDNQIGREVLALARKQLQPVIKVAYERVALHATSCDSDLRISFDTNIRTSTRDLSISNQTIGATLLPAGTVLMEIKTELGMPTFLRRIVADYQLRPTNFSKFERGLKRSFQASDETYTDILQKEIAHA